MVTLPNDLTVEVPNRGEAAFLYEEIFNSDTYMRYGIEVSDGATVFDVGANIGLFSAALAQEHRNLKLHLFEPVPSTFAILERNAQRVLAGAEVELHRVALVARQGRATLELNPKWSLDAGIDTQTFAREARRVVGLEAWTRALVHDAARAGGMSPRVARRLEQALRRRLVGRLLLRRCLAPRASRDAGSAQDGSAHRVCGDDRVRGYAGKRDRGGRPLEDRRRGGGMGGPAGRRRGRLATAAPACDRGPQRRSPRPAGPGAPGVSRIRGRRRSRTTGRCCSLWTCIWSTHAAGTLSDCLRRLGRSRVLRSASGGIDPIRTSPLAKLAGRGSNSS